MIGFRVVTAFIVVAILALIMGGEAERRLAIRARIAAWSGGASWADVAHDQTTTQRDNWNDAARRVACPVAPRPISLLILGQSNAANYVVDRSAAPQSAAVLYEGQCYSAVDPLLGATGDRGSIWSRLAGPLANATGRPILLVPIAVGSSSIESWTRGGVFHARIGHAMSNLAARGLTPDAIIYQQGEFEGSGRLDPGAYQSRLTVLLRELKATSRLVYVAPTSKCSGPANKDIRMAQLRAARDAQARLGVDMDELPDSDRRNVCHLSGSAAERIARKWLDILSHDLHQPSTTDVHEPQRDGRTDMTNDRGPNA